MDLMYLPFERFNLSSLSPDGDDNKYELKIVDYSKESEFEDKLFVHRKIFVPNYDLEEHINSLKLSYKEDCGFGIFFYLNGNLVGALDIERTNDFVYVMNFGVIPEIRGKGLGKKFLIKSLNVVIDKLSKDFEGIYLLVSKKNNVAKNLYECLGFEVKN